MEAFPQHADHKVTQTSKKTCETSLQQMEQPRLIAAIVISMVASRVTHVDITQPTAVRLHAWTARFVDQALTSGNKSPGNK
jgi:hypothetical protein